MALLGEKLKSSVHENPGAASEILAIAQDRLAIGYPGSGYNTSFVRMVPLAHQAGGQYIPPQCRIGAEPQLSSRTSALSVC
jgi:phosphate transport system substrate-binding protein